MSRTRFIADTMPDALAAARRALGPQMRVIHAATHRKGGLWPFGQVVDAEVIVEVIAERHPQCEPPDSGRVPRPASTRAPHLRSSELRLRMSARLALARAIAAARGAAEAAANESREAIQQAESAMVHGTPAVLPAVLTRMAARLRAQGLAEPLAQMVVSRVQAEFADDPGAPEDEIRVSVLDALAALLPVSGAADAVPVRADGRPRVIAVVGPTGVGKTTTVAKIAADCRVRLGLRVGIVAADAYRVGAVDQLHAYAQILGAPMRAADSPSAVRSAMLDLAWCDVVLVDTAGRSHRDAPRIAEIGAVLQAARPDETHLVLSGAGAARTLCETAAAFHHTRPTKVVLSKLDECESLGTLVHAVRESGCPVSWFTTGQDVPDDIEHADAAAFARRILDATLADERRAEVST